MAWRVASPLLTASRSISVAPAPQLGVELLRRRLDVSSSTACDEVVAWAHDRMGGLNGLINNAGILRDGLLVKKDKETGAIKGLPKAHWDAVIGVNLTGPFLCMRAFATRLVASGGGSSSASSAA